jgi:hypothetical protein
LALSTGYALAADVCAPCHPKEAERYGRTGMANSIGPPARLAGGKLQHGLSHSRMEILTGRDGMRHRLWHGDLHADYKVDYFIGSGSRGRSFLIAIEGRLFQSPASYYTHRKAWDVSPGFEGQDELDFDRPITNECLFCHAGSTRPVSFTLNSYESPPFEAEGITCARCHGETGAHLAKPSASNIVNPAKLTPALRDAVCDQCHLGGEARILHPGRSPWNYRSGEPLEQVVTVYVFDDPSPSRHSGAQKVVGHSEQLAASKCSQRSEGRLWCGSCHDPHTKPVNPAAWYRQRCEQCHSPASLTEHKKPAGDCAGCHMPSRPAYDGGHTPFTDHRILAKPRQADSRASVPLKLRAWREPPVPLAQRNLGLAHISVGERDQSAEHLNEGFRQLSSIATRFADDPAVLGSLGAVLQRKGVPREAAKLFARAAKREPRDARHRLNLAVALSESGTVGEAIAHLEAAISLDASLRDAYLLLADLYDRSGDRTKQRYTLERYLRFMPQSIAVRRMLLRR